MSESSVNEFKNHGVEYAYLLLTKMNASSLSHWRFNGYEVSANFIDRACFLAMSHSQNSPHIRTPLQQIFSESTLFQQTSCIFPFSIPFIILHYHIIHTSHVLK